VCIITLLYSKKKEETTAAPLFGVSFVREYFKVK
jgi:hypothetical protein